MHKQLIFGKEKSQLPPEFTKARLAQQEKEREANAAAENASVNKQRNPSDMHDVQSVPISPGKHGKGKDNLLSSNHNRSNSKLSSAQQQKLASEPASATTNNNENIITDF